MIDADELAVATWEGEGGGLGPQEVEEAYGGTPCTNMWRVDRPGLQTMTHPREAVGQRER